MRTKTLKTFEDEDGVVAGNHQVVIIASEHLSDEKQKWHAPKKYADPDTSELTAKIEEPIKPLTIELTWEGDEHGKPYIEISE